jgi:hypothetical protein
MTGPKRDWDKELADIDKLIASSPAVPPGSTVPAPAGPRAGPPAALPKREALGGWSRVLLGAAAAVGAAFWPYAHACGLGLWLYLGVAGTVVIAGVWGMVVSWRRRLGLAHVVALLVTLWGIGLVAAELLPRLGYAKDTATWSCS